MGPATGPAWLGVRPDRRRAGRPGGSAGPAFVRPPRPALDPVEVGWSLATARSAFEHRAVVTGATPGELLAGLDALAAGTPAGNVVTGTVYRPRRGHGVPVPGEPGRRVRRPDVVGRCPVFDDTLAECRQALAPWLDVDPAALLTGADTSWTDRPELAQPVLFAVGVALAAVWRHAGVTPATVIGDADGEIVAACVAGVLSLPDAARTVASRALGSRGRGRPRGPPCRPGRARPTAPDRPTGLRRHRPLGRPGHPRRRPLGRRGRPAGAVARRRRP